MSQMGAFKVSGEVARIESPRTFVRIDGMWVDTGSELSWLPRGTLEEAGVDIVKKDLAFVMADGRELTRSVGYAILRVGEFETVDEVVFAEPGDLRLLGARTLEGFGASVDPRGKRLVASGPHVVAEAAAVVGPSTGRHARRAPARVF